MKHHIMLVYFVLQTCLGKCDQLKDCVLCKGFSTGPLKDDMEKCHQMCNDTIVVDELDSKLASKLNFAVVDILLVYLLSRILILNEVL